MARNTSEMETRPDKEIVGVIGLGLMGTALTERLLEQGYRVAVWNRTRAKADPLLARGAVGRSIFNTTSLTPRRTRSQFPAGT